MCLKDNTGVNTFFSPFFVYIMGFIALFFVYQFNWSELYPSLTSDIIAFILGSCFVMFIVGLLFYRCNYFIYKPSTVPLVKIKLWCNLYVFSNIIEIIYSRQIPLISGLFNPVVGIDMDSFGIPLFHVFVISFGSFLSLVIFHKILSDKENRKKLYFLFFLSFLSPLIVYGRGIIFMTLTGCFLIYLMSIEHVFVKIVKLLIILIVAFFCFGVLGDIRVGASDSRFFNQRNGVSITRIGQATDDFENSIIPHEFMWSYIYIISPIGNLQYNLQEFHTDNKSISDLYELIVMEMLPETISKRISSFEKRQEKLVIPVLNVSTVYARAFVILGWIGIVLMFVFVLFYILTILLFVSPDSEFFIVTVAIINVILVFNLFDNMFSYGGYSNVIFIPLFLSIKSFIRKLQLKKNAYN
ncbi:MAG: O-antigen polymerase [Tannerellaceae bacterium]